MLHDPANKNSFNQAKKITEEINPNDDEEILKNNDELASDQTDKKDSDKLNIETEKLQARKLLELHDNFLNAVELFTHTTSSLKIFYAKK